MNITVEIFGKTSTGETYTSDSISKDKFPHFWKKSSGKPKAQLAIHRDENIVHYAYQMDLNDPEFFSIYTCINGLYVADLDNLCGVFENVVKTLLDKDELISYREDGCLCWKIEKINRSDNNQEKLIQRIFEAVREKFDKLECKKLFSCPLKESNEFPNGGTPKGEDVVKYKDYHWDRQNISETVKNNLENLNKKIDEIKNKKEDKKTKLDEKRKAQAKQKNLVWVLGAIAIIFSLGIVIWTKIINPAEVTKKDMGEYVYYGPIENGKPNGIGVAIYHKDDKDGRLYYYGNFKSGQRIDDNAVLFYKDGSYFNGKMNNDQWIKGLFFDVEQEHFVGDYHDNSPWNGDWYQHIKEKVIKNGQIISE